MKQDIEWHKEYLIIQRKYIDEIEKEIDRLKIQLSKALDDAIFYQYQISEALKKGKCGFDRDKFRVKKVKNENKKNS